MRRLLPLLLLGFGLATATPVLAQTLRPATTVTGSVVRLGDLFSDAGAHAKDAVAAAPAPGMRTIYGSDWLAAAARAHDLDWSPNSPYDQIVVDRASRMIGADAIAAQLMSAITAQQPTSGAELQLDNPGLHLIVAAEAPDAVAVDGLSIDPRSGRFSAYVAAPAGDPAATRQRVTGQLIYLIDVPVPNRTLAAGAVIGNDDLGVIKVRRDRLGIDMATDAAQLVGESARRPLVAGEPVRLGDVQRPILVNRGALVTIVLQTPNLQVTAQGKALEDGADGAQIKVENTKSNRVIDATVAGYGTVTVTAPGVALARAAATARPE